MKVSQNRMLNYKFHDFYPSQGEKTSDEMDGACSMHIDLRNTNKISVKKLVPVQNRMTLK
jgi:hypothetical protein